MQTQVFNAQVQFQRTRTEDLCKRKYPQATLDDVNTLQTAVSDGERDLWIMAGCEFDNESKLWRSPDGRVVAPKALLPWLARLAHGAGHTSKGGMSTSIGRQWFAPGFSPIAEQYCRTCHICQEHNPSRGVQMAPGGHPVPYGPFVHVQIDFIQLPKRCGFESALVIVDLFTKWVEAYPCRRADAITVVKLLMKDFICRFGIPCRISSDQGTHFTAEVVKEMCRVLQIKQHFDCIIPNLRGQ